VWLRAARSVNKARRMKTLDMNELESVSGGAGDYIENIRDKNGNVVDTVLGYYRHVRESGKNAYQKFEEHMQPVNRWWQWLNDSFGGVRTRPRPPTTTKV
jgi:bacteriocin-like protein